ncbi:hypothetical protein VFPFJ_04997 [Purpureocillium lilacinum]|uniref:Uncharacterized protein n=1 Tax=Purpureocillium lilacinum TaxID=33203 RepID=A0A179HME3_PURLI|nr:hypothetical protein VFPFJ_04997 [Purpureocillium lilacinum]OAQ90838.1 hypothetical protein VFPFJ_04997 [Purpureocillium lilacinum]
MRVLDWVGERRGEVESRRDGVELTRLAIEPRLRLQATPAAALPGAPPNYLPYRSQRQDAPLNALRNHGDYYQMMRDEHSGVRRTKAHGQSTPFQSTRRWLLAAGRWRHRARRDSNPARVSAAAASSTGLAWTLAGRLRNHQVTTIKEGQLVAITNFHRPQLPPHGQGVVILQVDKTWKRMKTRSFPPWPGQKEIEEKTEQHASSLHRTHPVNRAIMKPTTVLATFAALVLGSPSPAPAQSSRRAQQPVEFNIHDQGFTKIVCSRFPFTLNSERFENARSKNIEYFETAHKSKPVLEPGKCERVGCWDHIGTWWCNEVSSPAAASKEQKNPDSWKDVVKALKAIPEVAKKKCLAWNYRDFGFQIFHESGWSVMIGYDSKDLLVSRGCEKREGRL